jgi:hypothetical protein
MAERTIELRWHGRCCRCRAELGAGELARFDDRTRQISCLDCLERAEQARASAEARRRTTVLRLPPSEVERERVHDLIRDARAALAGVRRAG